MARYRNTKDVHCSETEKLFYNTPSEGSLRLDFKSPNCGDIMLLRQSTSYIEKTACLRLFLASRVGNVKCVEEYCKSAGYLDKKDSRGQTALHYAAYCNQVGVMNVLLQNGASVDKRDNNGVTPFLAAVRFNSKEAVNLLLEKGADPTATNTEGATALHFAARRGYKEIAEILLQDPKTNVNHCDNNKITALHLACISGSDPICQLLLEHGADTWKQTAENRTPLHFAAYYGHERIVELLIKHCGASPVSTGKYVNMRDVASFTALHLACQKGHVAVAKLCVSHGADACANAEEESGLSSPIHFAAASGSAELVELLLENGAQLDFRDEDHKTPLHRAACYNHNNVIKVLVEKGADIEAKDKNNFTPFLSAVRHGRTEAANFLLERGSDKSVCDESMRSCLHLAVKFNHLDTLRMLLNFADTSLLHNMDKNLRSALHYAASLGDLEMIKLFLDTNCKVDVTDVSEKTPLHLAATYGHVSCVEMLGKASPMHVNDQDERGLTALHIAAKIGNSDVCAALLRIGADVTAKATNHRTALHYAAEAGKVQTVEVLLLVNSFSSELEAQDDTNETPLHLASRNGHVEVVQLLLKKGANVTVLNNKGMTSLDIAIQNRRIEVAQCFVLHDRWYELLSNYTNECPRPMENLIEKLPEVAKVAMDRCVTYSEHDTSSNDFTANFDFRLLDPGPGEEDKRKHFFGPTTMLQHNREELLTHSLTHALLRWKWVALGKGIYYFNLAVYITFLLFVTAFVIRGREGVRIYLNRTLTEKENYKLFRRRSLFLFTVPIVVISFVLAGIVKEFYQIYLQRCKYFTNASNLLDWLVYVWALFFMLPFALKTSHVPVGSVLWPSGAGLVLCAFASLIASLRRFGFFGIYISMFLEVLKTALRVLLVFSLFILGFAIAFFILFKEQQSFHSVRWSFVKTTMMMIGELDYGSTITSSLGEKNPDSGAPLIPAEAASVIFFYLFCILMSVLLMNLLVGLAVGDIDTIRKNAVISAIALQVEFVAEIDQRYPRWLLRKVYKPQLHLRPNKPQGFLQWLMIYSLEDVSLGSKQYQFTKETEDLPENSEGMDHVKNQLNAQQAKMETFQSLLQSQNKLLKLMAAKLDLREDVSYLVKDEDDGGSVLDDSEIMYELQSSEVEPEQNHDNVKKVLL